MAVRPFRPASAAARPSPVPVQCCLLLFLSPLSRSFFCAECCSLYSVCFWHCSFEKLYGASFGGLEPFWVKGSTLEGVNFHETVAVLESRHVLGHINGNAIYNNTDPTFVDFVNFTFARWGYTYSYDVALWATISDFPYSWPLWQRYSRKFVPIDLVSFSNVKTTPLERTHYFCHASEDIQTRSCTTDAVTRSRPFYVLTSNAVMFSPLTPLCSPTYPIPLPPFPCHGALCPRHRSPTLVLWM